MGKPIHETLREVSPDLWVSDRVSARMVGEDFALVVDCWGKTKDAPNKMHARPTGKTNHFWTVHDLVEIAKAAKPHLVAGRPVLIHCSRGVSRSTCAAAAVMMILGRVDTIDEGIAKARFDESRINSHSIGSARKFGKKVEARRQLKLRLKQRVA